jgi:hypothetical protein
MYMIRMQNLIEHACIFTWVLFTGEEYNIKKPVHQPKKDVSYFIYAYKGTVTINKLCNLFHAIISKVDDLYYIHL